MAKITKDEFLEKLNKFIGDDTSDAAIELYEDASDSFIQEEKKTDETDWKQKYDDLDKEWRQRYRDRFFNKATDEEEQPIIEESVETKTTFSELFKTE